jgi:hypothetical protein
MDWGQSYLGTGMFAEDANEQYIVYTVNRHVFSRVY